MSLLSERFDAHAQSLRQLVEALDAQAPAETVLLLSERSKTLFHELSAGLKSASAEEHARLAPKLAQARRWSAIVSARCEQQRSQLALHLADLKRARQALAAQAGLSAGGSCDIAG